MLPPTTSTCSPPAVSSSRTSAPLDGLPHAGATPATHVPTSSSSSATSYVPGSPGHKAKIYELVKPLHPPKPGEKEAFQKFMEEWKAERTAEFDVELAKSLRAQFVKDRNAGGNQADIAQMCWQWASIPPKMPREPKSSSGQRGQFYRTVFNPAHLPFLGWIAPATKAKNAIQLEVDRILDQSDWKPVLAENIANSQRFGQIYSRMQEVQPVLQAAFDRALSLHDQMENLGEGTLNNVDEEAYLAVKREYDDAMKTLAEQATEAHQLCIDHEMATGLIYKAGLGNLRSIALGVLQGMASTVASPLVAPFVSVAFDLAGDQAKHMEDGHQGQIIERLNLQYGAISDGPQQVRKLWQGPIEAQLPLLDAVLSHQIRKLSDQPAKAKMCAQLQRERQIVRSGELENLSFFSWSAGLLLDKEKFRAAAYEAMLDKDFVERMAVNATGYLVTTSADVTGGWLDDPVAAGVTSSGVGLTVDASTSVAQSVSDARAAAQRTAFVAEPEEDPDLMAAGPTAAAQVQSRSQSGPRRTTLSNVVEGAKSIASSVQKLGSVVKDETVNAGMAVLSARAYGELFETYKKAAELLKTAGGTLTPSDYGTVRWSGGKGKKRPGIPQA